MVDMDRLWKFWYEVLPMSSSRRRLEVLVRALATVDMALRRVRTKRSHQRVIYTWIALVDQGDILKTASDAWAIYQELSKILKDCGLDVTYAQTAPRAYRQSFHIAGGMSITGRFKRVDRKLVRNLLNGFSADLERVRQAEDF